MLILLSPAKRMRAVPVNDFNDYSKPFFQSEAEKLVKTMMMFSPADLQRLMKISPALAELNANRFAGWFDSTRVADRCQAVYAFDGDAYKGLDIGTLKSDDIRYMQNKLRILSGLYGVLRPLDLIQEYRLEMGLKVEAVGEKSLVAFWKKRVSTYLAEEMKRQNDDVLVNLASDEYFNAVDVCQISGSVIKPVFKDLKEGKLKVISFYAKKARGWMTRYIIENRLKEVEELKGFNVGGYHFAEENSSNGEIVFIRN